MYFKYEDEEHHLHHLDKINITLQKGKKIALVGESGSGKSTLMLLLRGLHNPDQGHIFTDSKQTDFSLLSHITTLIPQEPEIFENTIEYNITAGIHHTKKEVQKAYQIAEFEKVLHRLPQRLQTDIKEKGVNLSGGEKQRLALARGVFAAKHSSLILLDEPTSSVDVKNETKIYKNIFQEFKDACLVSSVHKLNLLDQFDYIYIFEKGKMIEEGIFTELIEKKKGALKKMWEKYEK